MSHTSRRYPDLLSGCRVVCRGDKHGNAPVCNKQELTAADVRFDRLALAQDPALALKPSPAASPCSRPWPCNKQEMAAADVRFDRLALAQDPTLALKLLPAASPCTRPQMASSLKKSKVGQGRGRRAEAVRSSPQTTSPQPGDQSPCLHCLSMQTTVVCVGVCVPAYARV